MAYPMTGRENQVSLTRPTRGNAVKKILALATGLLLAFTGAAFANADEDNTACYEKFRANDYQSAIDLCTRAINSGQLVGPDLITALINRGVSYKLMGKPALAIADYTQALKLDPNDAVLYANRANALRDMKDLDRALLDANKAIKLDSKRAASFFVRGMIYETAGYPDGARNEYMEAVRRDPANTDYQKKVMEMDVLKGQAKAQGN